MSSSEVLSSAPVPTTSFPKAILHSQNDDKIKVVKLISKAKFPVYQAVSYERGHPLALKVFKYEKEQPHPFFRNESRFCFLDHPNVISLHQMKEKDVCFEDQRSPISWILMEYAPYGDFCDFIKENRESLNEKLIRTYFHQLIEGIEYLHKNDVCHLDLKLENLLLGSDYQLKIADFDLSYKIGDSKLLTKGTKFYRAPELKESKCNNAISVDIYAAGIILFVMKSGGIIPHVEESLYKGIHLFDLLNSNTEEFFNQHCIIQKKEQDYFSSDFKELFASMVKKDVNERATLTQVKNSVWYNKEIYSPTQLQRKVKKMLKHED